MRADHEGRQHAHPYVLRSTARTVKPKAAPISIMPSMRDVDDAGALTHDAGQRAEGDRGRKAQALLHQADDVGAPIDGRPDQNQYDDLKAEKAQRPPMKARRRRQDQRQ